MLKILSMLMVVILHILGYGGLLNSTAEGSVTNNILWYIEICSYCAVNIFGIITGYLMVNKKFKLNRIISLWLQVLFYGMLFNALFTIISPNSVGLSLWIKAIVPVSSKLYWYLTAYFGLFFIIPFINKLLSAMSKRQAIALVIMCFMLFSVFETIVPIDLFTIDNGYSMLWLAFLYIVGAVINKYDLGKGIKKKWFLLIYLLATVITFVTRIVLRENLSLGGLTFSKDLFLSYSSPFMVIMAVSLIIVFRDITFSGIFGKALKSIAPLSFAVYIIHQNPLVLSSIITDKFSAFSTINVFMLVGVVVLVAIVISAVCIIIDFTRVQLFKYTKITYFTNKIGDLLDSKINLNL